jgi:hypothetical protein
MARPKARRASPDPDTRSQSEFWLEAAMLWIILIVVIAAIVYWQRDRLLSLRR